MASAEPVMQGYMLKRRRKRLQGMARRYFQLSPTGVLSYSFNPSSPTRDSVNLGVSYVSASRKARTFHIDSGQTVMHCKALNLADFDRWTEVVRTFVKKVQEQQTRSSEDGHLGMAILTAGGDHIHGTVDLSAVRGVVAGMTPPIEELESILAELKLQEYQLTTAMSSPSSLTPSAKFKFFKTHGKELKADEHAVDLRPNPIVDRLGEALAIIKAQHDELAATLKAVPKSGSITNISNILPPRTYALRNFSAGTRSPTGRASHRSRASTSSFESGETSDFYEDAIAGEFVLDDEEPLSEGQLSEVEDESDEQSSFHSAPHASVRHLANGEQASEETVRSTSPRAVQRRAQLPAPVSGDEFSMLGMLRKNVGKDLTTISFPVTINEPLSALQRVAEELEYSDLLHRAAQSKNSIDRLALVAAFAISSFSGNKYRSSRKPFNPLLGETYECIRPDKGFRFVSEKVVHHPPVTAFYAEADSKSWEIEGHLAPSQKFWGRSFELWVTGEVAITFGDTQATYTVRKPSSFVRNLVAGTKYLEVVGDLIVTNEQSGERATINFKEGSAWGGNSSRNKIEGKVCDAAGEVQAELVGRWDEHVDRKEGHDSYQRLWEISEFPPHVERYYGFSQFAIELNETTSVERGHMAPTDSRLRPDQLALERGDVDEAEEIKKRVEEKQRAKRKAPGDAVGAPLHFVRDAAGDGWRYGGHYFEKRDARAFNDPDIF